MEPYRPEPCTLCATTAKELHKVRVQASFLVLVSISSVLGTLVSLQTRTSTHTIVVMPPRCAALGPKPEDPQRASGGVYINGRDMGSMMDRLDALEKCIREGEPKHL